jgi:hypothetical protein
MVSLKFIGVSNSEDYIEMKASSEHNLILFKMQENKKESFIILDRITAIKFSKELRKQISLIPDQHE